MKLEYIGLSEMEGSLIYLDGVSGIGYDEMAEIPWKTARNAMAG